MEIDHNISFLYSGVNNIFLVTLILSNDRLHNMCIMICVCNYHCEIVIHSNFFIYICIKHITYFVKWRAMLSTFYYSKRVRGAVRSWSYLSYQFLAAIRIPLMGRCTGSILCDEVCQWLATSWWFSSGTPVSSTYKTDRHNPNLSKHIRTI